MIESSHESRFVFEVSQDSSNSSIYKATLIKSFNSTPYLIAIDVQSMNYAILDNNLLLKYNSAGKIYEEYHNLSTLLLAR